MHVSPSLHSSIPLRQSVFLHSHFCILISAFSFLPSPEAPWHCLTCRKQAPIRQLDRVTVEKIANNGKSRGVDCACQVRISCADLQHTPAAAQGPLWTLHRALRSTRPKDSPHRHAHTAEIWRSWNLSTMLTEIISESDAAQCAADVMCALTIQRCIAPGSKVQGQRWFPRTVWADCIRRAAS